MQSQFVAETVKRMIAGRKCSMDKIDAAILNFLQKDARISVKDIAKEVYLSSPAVSTRIERLRKEGIIKGYTAKIDLTKVGYNVTAYINLVMKPSLRSKFYAFVENVPNVLECSFVTGEYSMHMKTAFHNTRELDAFITELQRFGSTSTQVVFSTSIEQRAIPIECDERVKRRKKSDKQSDK
ncbi:MAG: Lrp/AsnC family transcriptional regulator [Acutalibacteraceae bacterium]